MFDPLKKVTICEMVVQKIMEKIKSGELQVGDRLPSERELAESLQVSRISVREGIKILSSMGFLDVRVGDGTFVKKVEVSKMIEPLTCSLYLEKSALIELLESRKIIEVAIAGLAATRATADDLQALQDTLEIMGKNVSIAEDFRESDADFHIILAEIAHNSVLHRVIVTVRDLLKVSSKATYQVPGAITKAYEFHRLIYQAIAERNAERARVLMLKHLEDVESDLLLVHRPVQSAEGDSALKGGVNGS